MFLFSSPSTKVFFNYSKVVFTNCLKPNETGYEQLRVAEPTVMFPVNENSYVVTFYLSNGQLDEAKRMLTLLATAVRDK